MAKSMQGIIPPQQILQYLIWPIDVSEFLKQPGPHIDCLCEKVVKDPKVSRW